MTFSSIRRSWYSQSISLCLIVTFVTTMVITPRAQAGVMGLPQPGTMVDLSPAYVPLMITGLSVHPENPLLMDFIVSTGNSGMTADQVKKESDRLIKYFLACLTIPENNQWVNLSPYEKQRIVPEDLGQTVLGQDMMAQDYLLKQLTASLIYPEKNLGKNFWDTVYAKASQMYGTSQIPVNTFNKVWILPDTAKVFEHNNTVFVVKSHLKVMLDEDYLALKKHADTGAIADPSSVNNLGSKIVRQIILPAIEKEVNMGRNFAQLRQIYNSMILAVWFKKNLKQALLNQVYTDKSKVNGVNADDPAIKEKIYRQYLQAYKKGVFNYIKEEVDQNSQEVIPRKYFSGGLTPETNYTEATPQEATVAFRDVPEENENFKISGLTGLTKDEAMIGIERLSPKQIMDRFNLAYPDALYLSVLIAKYLSDRIKPVLGINGIASALLNNEARQTSFGMIDGKAILEDTTNSDEAKNVHMRVLELKGGLGTSFKREATLLRLTGRTTLADKGTDSYFENIPVQGFDVSGQPKQFNENISVAELKLLQYIHLAQQKEFSEVEVQELVNPESQDAVSKFWDTVYLADRVDDRIPNSEKRTYRQIFNAPNGGLRFNPDFIVQGVMPVVDAQTGEYNNNETLRSPGGHGAFVALTMDDNARNQKDLSVPRITVFTNGDGVNNMLPPAIAGWMVKQKAPIVMVTTTKQLLDLKGGLITLLSNTELPVQIREKLNRFETLSMEDIGDLQNTLYPYLLELAQAKAEGQQDIFQKMGITLGEKSAQFFNTNVHAQYHNILDPFLADLRNIIGDEKFYEIIGPDLIVNPKDKKVDGKPISVIQLEGASGSALLAMNRFVLTTDDPRVIALKAKYGITRLVYFVNFDEKLRSEVFTPEKFTWDHYLYAFTDLFSVNPKNGRLIFTPGPGRSTLPGLDLDKPYEDLEYDINAFGRHLGVRGLDYLAIKGEVRINDAILRGGVFIKNKSGKVVDLTTQLPLENGRLVLKDVFVNIDQEGNVTTRPVTNLLDTISNFDNADAAMLSEIDDGTADETNNESDMAMATEAVVPAAMATQVNIRPNSIRVEVSPQNQAVVIKQGTAGWRAFVNGNGNLQNGEGPFNEENVGRIVAALATKINAGVREGNYKPVRKDGKLHALVAYDSRPNGRMFATYAAGVAYAYGMDVDMSNDYVATPEAMARSLRSLKNKAYDVVIVVTASHNDYRYNGLKIGMNGTIIPDKLSGQVDALANDADFKTRYLQNRNIRFNQVDLKALASQQYQKAFPGLASSVAAYLSTTGKQLIVDFMHGSGGRYAGYYTGMGAEVRKTEPMRDNTYPKNMFMENGKEVPYRPQPIREMLDQELTEFETNSDVPEGSVYSAIDGDGDRFAAWVKQNGKAREISPNEVMLLTLWHLKESNRLPSYLKYIVVTAPTSYMVRKYAEAIGLKVIEESVGFKFLGPHLNGEDPRQAVLTWEESGHGGFRMVSPSGEVTTFVDDANAQSLYFLDIISSLPQGRDVLSVLDDLRNQIKYDLNYDKIAVNGTDKAKDIIRVPLREANPEDVTAIRDIAAKISQALDQEIPSDENITMTSSEDKQVSLTNFSNGGTILKLNEGLKLKFGDGSWVMIRMSGTEPLIRIYGEFKGNNPRNELNKLAKEVFNDHAMNVFPDEELDAPGINDLAQLDHQAVIPGGIDLNSRTLNMQSSGQKVNITFDPAMIAQFKRGDFSGVQIQILNVVPINLMPLLGLKEDEEPVVA